MKTGTLVRNTDTGIIGVVVDDSFGCCSKEEVPVVYEGVTYSSGTPLENLEDLGPENARADLKKCGAGQEEKCCIFLAIGKNGVECQRFGSLRISIILRKESTTAKREPTQLFPNCQLS